MSSGSSGRDNTGNAAPAAAGFVLAAYGVAGGFLLAEPLLRQGEAAKRLDAGAADAETTRLVAAAYGTVLIVGGLLTALRTLRLPLKPAIRALGLVTMILGLLVKVWAMRTLGRSYTRTLRVSGDQQIVTAGPYGLVRHPGYLGALLLWYGFAVALANGGVGLLVSLLMLPAYLRRMRAEEAMLVRAFGEDYARYRRRTHRVLPWLY